MDRAWRRSGAWYAERLADVVVPVPLHRQRERERGYNQAALLSKPLAKGCDCGRRPCC